MREDKLRERAEKAVLEFSKNVYSSQNPKGYKGIIVFGGDFGRRERLCERIQESFPPSWEEKPFVWEEQYKGKDRSLLYVDAGF